MTATMESLAAKWEAEAQSAASSATLSYSAHGPPRAWLNSKSQTLTDCAAELRAALARDGWQTMETAPRDGTFVHLWVSGDERSDGYSETGSWVASYGRWDIGAARQPDSMFTHWRPEFPPPEPPR